MKYSSIPSAQTIVQHFQARGVSHIIISPGSRNAPLTIAFTENSFFSCYSIVDERCAGFFALGIAQQLQKPVAVLCTSGSALVNYYPAIVEAYYSAIPLLVVSADRPSYKIDIGDGQTIRQKNIFENHIAYSATLKQDPNHATETYKKYCPKYFENMSVASLQSQVQKYNDSELNLALETVVKKSSPVHINVPLEEPLYNTLDVPSVFPEISKAKTYVSTASALTSQKREWNNAARKIVLIGLSYPFRISEKALQLIANDPSVLVFTETTSNVHHPNFFNSIDAIIAPIELSANRKELFQMLQPDLLVTFGGFVVSKKIKSFLRNFAPKQHWHVGENTANNTFNCLQQHLKIFENDFLTGIYAETKPAKRTYFDTWKIRKLAYQKKQKVYLKQIPFSDFLVYKKVLSGIPKGYQLQLANSSTIRYAQLFQLDKDIHVFCNRGTSGIDGSTSTAIGASLIHSGPTLLITGDLSFLYDSNALWNNYIRADFRIIVINNNGGGIFRILPGKNESENFKTFFETNHTLNAKHLCKMYGISYEAVKTKKSLKKKLHNFYDISNTPKLLEVFTPRLLNDKILMDYFRLLS